MKKKNFLALGLLITAGIARGAGNHLSVHYNNTFYHFSGYEGAKDNNFTLNGIGIGYDYKWLQEDLVNEDIFLFVDNYIKVNYDFGDPKSFGNGINSPKMKMQDLNIQYSESIGYMFDVNESFLISPFIGLNLRYHLLTRAKYPEENDAWLNFYSKEDMGADGKWKRFQVGWQVGVDFEFEFPIFLRVQYGTDFISNYSYKKDGYKEKIKSGNFQISAGYYF